MCTQRVRHDQHQSCPWQREEITLHLLLLRLVCPIELTQRYGDVHTMSSLGGGGTSRSKLNRTAFKSLNPTDNFSLLREDLRTTNEENCGDGISRAQPPCVSAELTARTESSFRDRPEGAAPCPGRRGNAVQVAVSRTSEDVYRGCVKL